MWVLGTLAPTIEANSPFAASSLKPDTFAYLRSGSDYLCPAPIPDALARQIQELALRTYRAVECRDMGRVDFRVDRQSKIYVMEINPLPALNPDDALAVSAYAEGLNFPQLLEKIVNECLKRYKMKK